MTRDPLPRGVLPIVLAGVVAGVVAWAAALAAVAAAAATPATKAGDQRIAQQGVLRVSDFAKGWSRWRGQIQSPADRALAKRCQAGALWTSTATHNVAFSRPRSRTADVVSSISTYNATHHAVLGFARERTASYWRCDRDGALALARNHKAPGIDEIESFTVRPASAPELGNQAGARLLTTVGRSHGIHFTSYNVFVFIRVDRAIATIEFLSGGRPDGPGFRAPIERAAVREITAALARAAS